MATFKQLLVPLDGSELAEQALPLAATLAKQFEGEIYLIRAVDFLKQTGMGSHLSSATATRLTDTYKEEVQVAHDYLHRQQQALQEQGCTVQTLLREVSAVDAIITAAETHQIDCIVMSTHGRGGLMRLTMGSVADQIVRNAPCPVLLVRPPQQKPVEADGEMVVDDI